MTENIIEIQQLDKNFGKIHAVDNLSFNVKRGELFAFLGENGAGKSTTISIICGQLAKDGGKVYIDGFDTDTNMQDIKPWLGVVYQSSVLDSSLTVYDNLESRAALYNMSKLEFEKRLETLCELLDLKDLLRRTLSKLSGGQKRRIDIARALLHKPKILILDEPTTGLDPQTRATLWNVISTLRETENITVFLTTHYMEEAADADYVVILDKGKIAASGTPLELKNTYACDYITIYNADETQIQKLGQQYSKIRDAYKVTVQNTTEATKLIINNAELFKDYEITKGKMDDVFLNVTGKKMQGGEQK